MEGHEKRGFDEVVDGVQHGVVQDGGVDEGPEEAGRGRREHEEETCPAWLSVLQT